MKEEREAVIVVIRGEVQGVGFRHAMVHQARRLSLAGWVRNRSDGSVEAHIEGAAKEVATLLFWCRQGPPFASVEDLTVQVTSPCGYSDFFVCF